MNLDTADHARPLSQVPVTILPGFLGAGKTRLLNHVLTGARGKRIAVLVNDFGAVNIDEALIETREGDVLSLENGCIRCSLSAGLQVAAAQLVWRQPDRRRDNGSHTPPAAGLYSSGQSLQSQPPPKKFRLARNVGFLNRKTIDTFMKRRQVEGRPSTCAWLSHRP